MMGAVDNPKHSPCHTWQVLPPGDLSSQMDRAPDSIYTGIISMNILLLGVGLTAVHGLLPRGSNYHLFH